ncbi:MAG: hypothetical protein J6B50_00755 [Lachnospiraceae bacterium]|nr:hypothetical protein [Lachnospiraceae bacterium]
MKQKKNRFLVFLCSLLPGAGEMYLGFMKMGLSLLIGFFGTMGIASLTGIDQLLFVTAIIWIYSFFHANNLGGIPEEEFMKMEDTYMLPFVGEKGMSKTLRRIVAGLLIFMGVIMLGDLTMRMLPDAIWNLIPTNLISRLAVAIVLIIIGIKMIAGKKESLEAQAAELSRQELPAPQQPQPDQSKENEEER